MNDKNKTRKRRKAGPLASFRRWQRRLYRRHPKARRAVNTALAGLGLAAALCAVALLVISLMPKAPVRNAPRAEIAAPALEDRSFATEDAPALAVIEAGDPEEDASGETSVPTGAPTPEPTEALATAPTPDEKPSADLAQSVYRQSAAPGAEYANPVSNRLLSMTKVYSDARAGNLFATDEDDIHMGSSDEYSHLEGVTTFRGSNYRDGGGYGVIPTDPTRLTVTWKKRIRSLDEWTGVGWTGQASIVRWPADLRSKMNIVRAKKEKDGLTEVIYATLDGRIYFLDLEDGQDTRNAINIGAPIKGSLTVDPRGVPLLYCGQGIYDVGGNRVACGTRIWSLIDQKLLYFLDGKDKTALRAWAAFDCSPLVDGDTDTMITAGENGVLYKVRLNTQEYSNGVLIDPTVTRYVYQQSKDGKLGTENSVAIYNNYVYFATNIGIIQCVDLNAMSLVWSFDAKDDIDASLVIEPESDGVVALYATNELDKRGHDGRCQMFKLNALTGELLWKRDSDKIYQNNDNGGGGFGTPAVGKGELDGLVYFHICRTEDSKGMLYALDKDTGETVWAKSMGAYGWSSPTCLYSQAGKGYVLVGSSNGKLRLLDGLTGHEVASVELKGNIEGTPAVFNDMIVVGTRDQLIYGIQIA